MMIHLLRAKIHRACVTDGNPDYEGSITVSVDLMDAVGMLPYEKVLVGNITSGSRFETYLIPGKKGAGEICLNGGTAHCAKKGELLTLMTYAELTPDEALSHEPRKVTLLPGNKLPAIPKLAK